MCLQPGEGQKRAKNILCPLFELLLLLYQTSRVSFRYLNEAHDLFYVFITAAQTVETKNALSSLLALY